MTKFTNAVALGATVVAVTIGLIGFAQDDLDDLLKDLEGDNAKPAAKAEEKVEEKAEEPAKEEAASSDEKSEEKTAESAKEEATSSEEKTEEKAEEPAQEEAKAEEKAEESAKEVAATEEKAEETAKEEVAATEEKIEEKAEEKAEETTATTEKVDEVLTLLKDLADESAEAEGRKRPSAPVAEKPSAEEKVAADTVSEPAAAKPAAAKAPAPKAVVAKPKKPAHPDAELLENLATTEKLRRRALDAQAAREIADARASMEAEEFTDVVRHYGNAAKLLNDRPGSKNLLKECNQGIAEGLYRAALQEDEFGRRDKAVALAEKAVEMKHPKARAQLEEWLAEGNKVVKVRDLSEVKHRKNDKDYKSQREQIRKHLRRSRQLLAVRDMEGALEECEVVLVNDPYNQEAIRLRGQIERKRHTILMQERKTARDGMIADVDEAWRPVYAVNAKQLNETASETVKNQTGDDPERTQEQEIEARMKAMRLPTISFKPPATIMDAVEFFRQASKDYDRPDIPVEKRGFNFVLRTPQPLKTGGGAAQAEESDDFSSNDSGEDASGPANGLDPIPTITASDITFHEALKLVCDSVDYKFIVRGPVVMVMHKDMSTAEILSRKYNVPEAFMERVQSASSEIKEMGGFGNGGSKKNDKDEEESPERDWKVFFEEMGVKWPEGSSIKHVKALGKLYVRNTRENLAEFEKVLDELGGQPMLIEIETRFVEVAQDDLNSLGFEWILNSDYSLNVGRHISKALGLKDGTFGTPTYAVEDPTTGYKTYSDQGIDGMATGILKDPNVIDSYASTSGSSWRRNRGYLEKSSIDTRTVTTTTVPAAAPAADPRENPGAATATVAADPITTTTTTWSGSPIRSRQLGVNAFGGTSAQQNGNRYLSTSGNHISGESKSTNDQFMRVNAFLGEADLSMILHMLSQRSDTDLLSAPKVVTKSGENAVIKVVTEYIYPQDYDVQLQSSGSSGGSSSSSGGGSSAILAVVEPQNFTMREVGVILDVLPTYLEANGGTIELELKPQVVDEPIWHNYGMKIPFSGNSSVQSFEGLADIPARAVEAINNLGMGLLPESAKQAYADAIMTSSMAAMSSSGGSGNMTWYDAPMEQPWFHVRSIDSKVSITPGATVVMGGLITEQRRAMDDKIPFLGDIPYIGRLFRSHAEQTSKRNLLIFVTGRLITPAGRELHNAGDEEPSGEVVKEAPKAE